jgi:hypothetical protein
MIQRIQSIWLLLTALCAALTFKLSFFSGNKPGEANMPKFEKLTATSNFLLLICTALLVAGAIIIIFLYKTRKQQIWFTLAGLAISLLSLFFYFSETKKFIPGQGTYDLTAILYFAIPVLLILAVISIWKDEKLVRSADRLR